LPAQVFAPEAQQAKPQPQILPQPGQEPGERPKAADAQGQAPRVAAKVWSLETGKQVASVTSPGGDVVSLQFSPDGKFLATGTRSGVVKLYSSPDYTEKTKIEGPHTNGVDLVFFLKDGKTLVSANAGGLVKLWDVESGKARAGFTHFGGMNAIVASPDGKTLATGGGRAGQPEAGAAQINDIRIWDVTGVRRLAVLPVAEGRVTRLAFAPDGQTLAVATESRAILLWNIAEPAPRFQLSGRTGVTLFLVFSPDGKTLAAGGEDAQLYLWDVSTGKLEATLNGHADAITWIAFSKAGQAVITASRDATLKLWDWPRHTGTTRLPSGGEGGQAVNDERARMQGTWQLVYSQADGKTAPAERVKAIRVEINGNRHSVYFSDEVVARDVSFTLDPTAAPAATDDTINDGPDKGKQIHGIYKLEGDTLISCVSKVGQDRPQEFTAQPGSGHTLRVFLRVRPGEDPKQKVIRDELIRFGGSWRFAEVEVDGTKKSPETFAANRLVLQGDRFLAIGAKDTSAGYYKIDPTATPKTMEATFTSGASKGTRVQGIYELAGDTCRTCVSEGDQPRPATFETKAGGKTRIEVLKREIP
jgi:uncharacterized protein (TIGR03067 family)